MSVSNPVSVKNPDDIPVTCPACRGKDAVESVRFVTKSNGEHRHEIGAWPCDLCKGAKVVTAAQAAAFAKGRQMRDERVARGESLFEAAKRMGISSAQLSAIEHGRAAVSEPDVQPL